MVAKRAPITRLNWLIEQKSALESAIKVAMRRRQFTQAQFKRARLMMINRQWTVVATRIDAHNEQYFE